MPLEAYIKVEMFIALPLSQLRAVGGNEQLQAERKDPDGGDVDEVYDVCLRPSCPSVFR
jgi:hypothetical protein